MARRKAPYAPPVVFAVHGIRTDTNQRWWGHQLEDVLRHHNIQCTRYEYGFWPARNLLSHGRRKVQVERFADWYDQWQRTNTVDLNQHKQRPSVVAHSFGTFIVANALQKYCWIKFDKVILCGSVLPSSFDWGSLIGKDQVGTVLNDFGKKDYWVWVCPLCSPFRRAFGRAGRVGFREDHPPLLQEQHRLYEHPDYFHRGHMDRWVPVLKEEPQSGIIKPSSQCTTKEVRKMLEGCNAIDANVYGKLEGFSAAQCTVDEEFSWVDREPEIYNFLLNKSGLPLGYVNVVPITKGYRDRLIGGNGLGYNMKSDDVEQYGQDHNCTLYLVSIAVDPQSQVVPLSKRDSAAYRLFLATLSRLGAFLSSRRIGVEEVIATAWTAEGKQMCIRLGMQHVAFDTGGHSIMSGMLDPSKLPANAGASLRSFCNENAARVAANRSRKKP